MIQLRRHGTMIRALVLALIAAVLVPVTSAPAQAHPGRGDETFNALLFSKTAGFRHDSIPAGIQAITELAAANNFTVTATEDASMFNDTELAKYEVVIWLSTTGDVLNARRPALRAPPGDTPDFSIHSSPRLDAVPRTGSTKE